MYIRGTCSHLYAVHACTHETVGAVQYLEDVVRDCRYPRHKYSHHTAGLDAFPEYGEFFWNCHKETRQEEKGG